MNGFMLRTTFIQDLKWSLILSVLSLILAVLWQWPFLKQSYQGSLFSQIKQLEQQKASQMLQGIRTFNLQQVYELQQQGKTLFVDARSPQEFRELHIEGAINLTADELSGLSKSELSKRLHPQRPILVYCANEDCHASLQVAELLQNRGYPQVAVFLGGFRAWDEAGYPVDITR
jgi:rhodanese-related sulfurtransferase